MTTGDITGLIEEHLAGSDKFLVDVLIKPANKIFIFIDGDHGVTIADCMELSRYLESKLDREAEDFELNVSSPGADHSFSMPRQYNKNIGRMLQVSLDDKTIVEGRLDIVEEDGIVLFIKEDKKKKTPAESKKLLFRQIIESKVIISFK